MRTRYAELEKIMSPWVAQHLGVEAMTGEQVQALYDWGMKMFGLGEQVVADVENIRFGGRLIVLDDGSRWEVDASDAVTAESWEPSDRVVIIDGLMYKLDDCEHVAVEEDY